MSEETQEELSSDELTARALKNLQGQIFDVNAMSKSRHDASLFRFGLVEDAMAHLGMKADLALWMALVALVAAILMGRS